MKRPIFVPCSPIFSLARASSHFSNGVFDFASSKTMNGRSLTAPYFRLPGGGEGSAADVPGETDAAGDAQGEGDGEGLGLLSEFSASSAFLRASGVRFSLSSS